MIRVVSHQRRQIERDGETGLALRKQIAKARIRVFGCSETRELAHGPKLAAVHRGVDAAGVRRLPGKTEIALRVPPSKIGLCVEASDWIARDGSEVRVAIGSFLKSGVE